MEKKRILIADDHLIVREGLKLIFETESNYEIVGEAKNGRELVETIDSINPDVVLMDLNMPEVSGIEAMELLLEKGNKIPVIILTTYNEKDLIRQGLALGARGYLLKDSTREELIRTVDAAIRGEILLQPQIGRSLFHEEAGTSYSEHKSYSLTEKELLVLQGISRGCTSKEIAYDMGISERTVKAHLTSIYSKLQVESRSEAVAFAIKNGIIHLPHSV